MATSVDLIIDGNTAKSWEVTSGGKVETQESWQVPAGQAFQFQINYDSGTDYNMIDLAIQAFFNCSGDGALASGGGGGPT